MNRAIRRVGFAVTVLILVLVGAAHVPAGGRRRATSPTTRATCASSLDDFNRPRGEILTADGADRRAVGAATDDGDFKYQRVYPHGDAVRADQRLPVVRRRQHRRRERATTACSPGATTSSQLGNLGEILVGQGRTPATSCSRCAATAQQLRGDALEGQQGLGRRARREDRRGAGDVLEPDVRPEPARRPRHRGGQHVVLHCSTPTRRSRCCPARTASCYPPGSTFKIVTAGRRDRRPGIATPDEPVFPRAATFPLPRTTTALGNFGGGDVRWQPHREPRATRATRRSRSSASSSATTSCRA